MTPTDCAPSTRIGSPVGGLELVHRQHGAGRPEDVRDSDEPRPRGDRIDDLLGLGVSHHDARARGVQRADEAEVLVRRRDHLVAFAQVETRERDIAAVGRRGGQRDLVGRHADERCDLAAEHLTRLE